MRPTRDLTSAPAGSSIPDTRAVPADGLRRPAKTLRSVVLPAPLGPKSARHSPARREKEIPASAFLGPKERVSSLTSTIAAVSVEVADVIRLELATLARRAQNAVSLKCASFPHALRPRDNDRHRRPSRRKP